MTNYSLRTRDDGVSSSLLNVTLNLLEEVIDARFEITVKMPESTKDSKFTRTLFRTTINMSRFLRGVGGNSLSKMLMSKIVETVDFEFKFPLKPGIYRMINLSWKGEFLPLITTNGSLELKAVGKFKKAKGITCFFVKGCGRLN